MRAKLMKEPLPKSLQGLIKTITPPKGVKRVQKKTDVPPDEGFELMDCEGEEIDEQSDELKEDEELEVEREACTR